MFCRSMRREDPERESDAWLEVEKWVLMRYFQDWKYFALKKQLNLQRWLGEYCIFFWRASQGTFDGQKVSKREEIAERVIGRLRRNNALKERVEKVKRDLEEKTLVEDFTEQSLEELQKKIEKVELFLEAPEDDSKVVEKAASTPSTLIPELQNPHVLWDDYVERLRINIRKRYVRKKAKGLTEEQERELQDPEERNDKIEEELQQVKEHNKRMDDNNCYYEFLGECHIHGMMDGEAMTYQNENRIGAKVFELR